MQERFYKASLKTSPPSLANVVVRARLIDALADLVTPAKWLQAPSGTGKSTLAASYVAESARAVAWYRFDERDNDPAFFFREFAGAVEAQCRLSTALPKLQSDDHANPVQFARRFFATLIEQLQGRSVLVLDDVHQLTAEPMLASLACLIDLANERTEVLLVSEPAVPTAFFDAIAARRLAMLNDVDLHFDTNECKTMTAALRIDDAQQEKIAALTGGHAGALVLACELLRSKDPNSVLGVETVERIHLHLLSKLIERMPLPRRTLLLQTAFVTQVTRPIATKLAGEECAQQLDTLVDAGVLRRVGADATEAFEAHGLVRQGIRTLAQAHFGPTEARALAERTATTLIARKSGRGCVRAVDRKRFDESCPRDTAAIGRDVRRTGPNRTVDDVGREVTVGGGPEQRVALLLGWTGFAACGRGSRASLVRLCLCRVRSVFRYLWHAIGGRKHCDGLRSRNR